MITLYYESCSKGKLVWRILKKLQVLKALFSEKLFLFLKRYQNISLRSNQTHVNLSGHLSFSFSFEIFVNLKDKLRTSKLRTSKLEQIK